MTRTFEAWYKRYVKQCDEKYLSHVDDLTKRLTEMEISLQKIIDVRMQTGMTKESDLDEKIRTKQEEVFSLKAQLDRVERIREEMDSTKLKQTAKKVYDKLAKHPSIEKIEVSKETTLNIYTKKLKVKGQEIGNYKLSYNLPSTFYIRNLEYVVEGQYDHWHVNYGEPCLASWKPILYKQLDTYQIFLFIDTLIHYLLLSNDAHAYMTFEKWLAKFKKKEKIDQSKISPNELSEGQTFYVSEYISAVAMNDIPQGGTGWVTTNATFGTDTSNTADASSYQYWSTTA